MHLAHASAVLMQHKIFNKFNKSAGSNGIKGLQLTSLVKLHVKESWFLVRDRLLKSNEAPSIRHRSYANILGTFPILLDF